jgi:hypothetical protein
MSFFSPFTWYQSYSPDALRTIAKMPYKRGYKQHIHLQWKTMGLNIKHTGTKQTNQGQHITNLVQISEKGNEEHM